MAREGVEEEVVVVVARPTRGEGEQRARHLLDGWQPRLQEEGMFPPALQPEVVTGLIVEDATRGDVRAVLANGRAARDLQHVARRRLDLQRLLEGPVAGRCAL